MTKNEQIASILLEAAELLKNDNKDIRKYKKELQTVTLSIINKSEMKKLFNTINDKNDSRDSFELFTFDISLLWRNNKSIEDKINNMTDKEYRSYINSYWNKFDNLSDDIKKAIRPILNKYGLKISGDGDKYSYTLYIKK